MSADILYPKFKAVAKPVVLTLDQRIALAAKRPGNPLKKLEQLANLAMRIHGGCKDIADSQLDLGAQKALAISVVRAIEECVVELERL